MSDASDLSQMTVSEFLKRLDAAWGALQTFIESRTAEQLTVPTDAAGWTVKDHLIHLVVWEDGINALLEGEDRRGRMGVDEATWVSRDFDAINSVIQQQNRERSLADVLDALNRTHAIFRQHVAAMSDADLQRPYKDFAPASDNVQPIIGWLEGDSFAHYEEHIPWMQAISDRA
ncbi:MAG: ClbS/DfsB family four-helix bundle protein [Anaerolineae bacterium]